MTPKVERLVNLTIALLEARRPITFAELKRRTRYYDQGDPESARRMFERDKKLLRSLGVPIETHELAFSDEVGYRVPRPAYELPDPDLTPGEVAALGLALEASGADDSRLALAKLAARAPDPDEFEPITHTRLTLAADPVDQVAEAVATRTPLRFDYRTAAGRAELRRVRPHAIAHRRGAWYLVAHDLARDALRVFRLDRVRGTVRTDGEPGSYPHPDELDVAGLIAGPEGERVEVEIAAEDRARFELARRGAVPTDTSHGDRTVLRIPELDELRDRAWLLGFGADVEVLAPAALREQLIDALERLVAQHR